MHTMNIYAVKDDREGNKLELVAEGKKRFGMNDWEHIMQGEFRGEIKEIKNSFGEIIYKLYMIFYGENNYRGMIDIGSGNWSLDIKNLESLFYKTAKTYNDRL